MSRPPRVRVDALLVSRGLAPSRARAQAMVMAGIVRVNGTRVDKAGTSVPDDAQLSVDAPTMQYVSRGGEKLAGALEAFRAAGLEVAGKVAADLGASTGGFTDCLLQHGAARVHAVDVGKGLLHEKLRGDARVVVHENTNARHLAEGALGEGVQLAVVDASFISLLKLLDGVKAVLGEGGGVGRAHQAPIRGRPEGSEPGEGGNPRRGHARERGGCGIGRDEGGGIPRAGGL